MYESREKWQRKHSNTEQSKELSRFLEPEDCIFLLSDEINCKQISVHRYDINDDVYATADEIRRLKNPILWNLTDGCGTYKGSYVPAYALIHDIPHVGSSTYLQMLAQNKWHTKLIMESLGIKSARGINCITGIPAQPIEKLHAPYFVKPTMGDNSIADVTAYPLCYSWNEVNICIKKLHKLGLKEALVEEFLSGNEYSVAGINTGEWFFLCEKMQYQGDFWSSVEKDSRIEYCTDAEPTIAQELCFLSQKIIEALGVQDYFRIDFRMGKDGTLYFLEINTAPFLCCEHFNRLFSLTGCERSTSLQKMIMQSYTRQTGS